MARERELRVKITGDSRGAVRAFNDLGTASRTMSGRVGGAMRVAGRAFAGLAVGGAAAGALGLNLANAASDVEEAANKVSVLFGESADAINDWSETAATAVGLSQAQALDAAGSFGTLFQAFDQRDSAQMSRNLVELAADLGSFNNIASDDAAAALFSGLVGETEPLRRLGVVMNASQIEARALAEELIKPGEELDEQTKIQARYLEILAQTSSAQGDFERTSGSLANQQKILGAQWTDLRAQIGTALLPAFQGLFGFISERGIPAMQAFSDLVSERGFGGALQEVGGKIADALPGILSALGDAWTSYMGWMWEQIKEHTPVVLEALGEVLGAAAEWIVDEGLPMLGTALLDGAGVLVEWIDDNDIPQELADWAGEFVDWLTTEGPPLIAKAVEELVPELVQWVKDAGPDVLIALGNLGHDMAWAISVKLPIAIGAAAFTLGAKIMGKLWEGVGSLWLWLKSKFEFLADVAITWFSSLPGRMYDLGREMMRSAWNGIKDQALSIGGLALDIFGGPLGLLDRKFFGISVDPFATGGVIPQNANGGPFRGVSLVGERGPELLVGGGGSRVVPNHKIGGPSMVAITLEVDGRKLADTLVDVSERTGGIPLRVA